MLASGIYYKNKNSFRQLLSILPGVAIYPRDNNLVPYTQELVTYVNHNTSLGAGDTVTVKVNGVDAGTPYIDVSTGFYAVDFQMPYGTFTVESFPSAGTYQAQTFRSVNLYTFLDVMAEQFKEYKIQSVLSASGLYAHLLRSGILRMQSDSTAFVHWGNLIDFPMPFNWEFPFYADVVGGNQYTSVPGFIPTFPKGSTTGAVKDVVETVTGYRPVDADFELLQRTTWQLSRDGVKYAWQTGSVVDTGAAGPHYFLNSTRTVTLDPPDRDAVPVAVLSSDIQKAFTILLRVVTDGFFVSDGETILRNNMSGSADDFLAYTYLNPWYDNPHIVHDYGFQSYEDVILGPPTVYDYTLPSTPFTGQERLHWNGAYQPPDTYTLSGADITITGLAVVPGDALQVDYVEDGPVRYRESFVRAGSDTYTLARHIVGPSLEVYLNGLRLDGSPGIGQFTFTDPDTIEINVASMDGDSVDVTYTEDGSANLSQEGDIYDDLNPPTFVAPAEVEPDSLRLYVEGVRQSQAYISLDTDGATIIVDYSGMGFSALNNGDVITVAYALKITAGYNVVITQGANIFTQGYHFDVDYTYGQIHWDLTKAAIPAHKTSYLVYYSYFPKQILDQMLQIIKPATMILHLQFETTAGDVFRPFFWNDMPNPTGKVRIRSY